MNRAKTLTLIVFAFALLACSRSLFGEAAKEVGVSACEVSSSEWAAPELPDQADLTPGEYPDAVPMRGPCSITNYCYSGSVHCQGTATCESGSDQSPYDCGGWVRCDGGAKEYCPVIFEDDYEVANGCCGIKQRWDTFSKVCGQWYQGSSCSGACENDP